MFTKFKFSDYEFYVNVNKITLYQQIILKDSDNNLTTYAQDEALDTVCRYLCEKFRKLSIMEIYFDVANLNLNKLIKQDLIINQINYGEIFFQEEFQPSIEFYLNNSWLSSDAQISTTDTGSLNDEIKISYPLSVANTKLKLEECRDLSVGDVILFDNSFLPDNVLLRCGNHGFLFQLEGKDMIFLEDYNV